MEIGKIIKAKREEKNLTIEDLSNILGIPKSTLEKIENNKDFAIKDSYGKLYAKKVCQYFNIEYPILKEEIKLEEINNKESKVLNYVANLFPHTLALIIFAIFLYANASFKENINIQVKPYQQNKEQIQLQKEESKNKIIDYITLRAEDEVWITATIDDEKTIFNLKKGEEKVIYFNKKIAFETIGNANKLIIVFGDDEVKISNTEIIHNIFIDSEGIFYNGYNILRGVPKI